MISSHVFRVNITQFLFLLSYYTDHDALLLSTAVAIFPGPDLGIVRFCGMKN